MLKEILKIMSDGNYIWIIGGLLSLVNFLFWNRIKRIEKDIEENRNRSTVIEKNYLSRFEDLTTKISEVEKNIIKEIYSCRFKATD